MLMYTSAAGKELHLSVDPKSPLLTFKWEGGGEIPQELQGLFTAEEMARKAFNMWRAKKEDVVGMEIAK